MKPDRLTDRLETLKRYVGYLKGYQKISLQQLHEDHTLQGAICHYFQLAIECMLDTGELLVIQKGLPRPKDGRDVFEILGDAGVLPKKFAFKIAPIAGFRNIIVHEYLKVDMGIVHERLQKDLKDFDTFARHIAKNA